MHAAVTSRTRAAVVAAPFGHVAIECDDRLITGLTFIRNASAVAPSSDLAVEAADQLARYLRDPAFRFDLPLAVSGTPFQRRVWDAIAAIACGTARQYGELARELEATARAVGQACGDNRLPIVIPCHRVVGATGLGGFAHANGGFPASVKRWLLEHEGALRGTLL